MLVTNEITLVDSDSLIFDQLDDELFLVAKHQAPGHFLILKSNFSPQGLDAFNSFLSLIDSEVELLYICPQSRQIEISKLFELNNRKSDRKSTRLNSSHIQKSRMPSSA